MADYTGIPDELKAKLLKWEQNNLRALQGRIAQLDQEAKDTTKK